MTPVQPRPTDAIICAGARIPCAAPVVLWGESGLSFQGRPRRKQTRVVTLHWTAGEGGAQRVFETMVARKVSVPFFIDAFGVIYQFCDADRETVHCPGWNKNGIGIEIQNRGSDLEVKLPKGVARATVKERIHGSLVEYSDFTAPQILSVVTLVRTLCAAYHLPVQVPLGTDGRVLTRTLSKVEMEHVTGVVGHYLAYGSTKADPGPKLLRLIHDQESEDGRA